MSTRRTPRKNTTAMADNSGTEPIVFVVRGQPLPGGVAAGATRGAGTRVLPGQVKSSVRLGALRGDQPTQRLSAVPGEDVVALHIAGGPVLLLDPASARDLLLAQAGTPATRGGKALHAGTGDVAVSAALHWRGLEQGTPTRGLLGDVVLAAFEVLTGFGKGHAAELAAGEVVARVDAQVEAGVYALSPDALDKLKGSGRLRAQLPASAEPMLVFIHGTFVETTSTFGKLWALHPQRVRQLFQHYGNRVYALEHETLGKSPAANALKLVQALPTGARLHLVTHSRGGLVAEVLARMAHQRTFTAADERFFVGADYAGQRQELRDLAAAMKTRDVHVERVVRVACPARGTLLASKRMDAYLSVLKWAIEATGVPLVPAVVDFLIEVARRRADPLQLPGLAAMIPDTPILNWLNTAPEKIAGDLRVVAGDMEGDSLGSWLKTLLTDAYYWTDNDIVVQTRSMYAGAPRAGGASFLLDQGAKTTHFAYFVNPRTVDAVVEGLVQPLPPANFAPIGPLSWAGKDSFGLRGLERDPGKPAVFVLPGILGSNLSADGHRIWLGLRLIGGLDQLAYEPGEQTRVQPDGPIGLVYNDLIEHLGATHEVIPFAFDWRRPIEEEAQRLALAVTKALDARKDTGQPVRLLAHSMGGVLARTMQIEAPQVWARLMAHDDARLLMLGTPSGGSWAPMQVLSGDDTFGNALAAFGSPLADHRARKIMAAMPGFLQLQQGLTDPALKLDQRQTWDDLATRDYAQMQQANWWHRHAGEAMECAYQWGVPPQDVLDQARALRVKLDRQLEDDLPGFAHKLLLVVGHATVTPVGFEEGDKGFVYIDAPDGDGRVPLQSALLPGVKTWKLDVEHGSLPSEKKAFDAFVELLEQGQTTRLEPLAATRGGARDISRAGLPRSRPSRSRRTPRPAQSQRAVFGVDDTVDSGDIANPSVTQALQLEVLNGNLSFVAEPLLVGHYRSIELTGTEGVVDRLIGGTMKAALAAGLYPDAVGTQQVFVNARRDPFNPNRTPRPLSVLVVGLGEEGALREAELAVSVRQGVLAWAQRLAEGHAAGPHTLAATLLGSGGLGITAGAAARAIARGVSEANALAAAAGWPRVAGLTLVELYLDRATDAWNGLQLLADSGGYVLAPQIRNGTGPLRRQIESTYRGADYDLISATMRDEGTLEFVLDSSRARTEVRAQRTQAELVREMVAVAATARNDDPQIGRKLFQLLVPGEIAPFLGGAERMVLDLDAGTAALPWELLDTGGSDKADTRPWALRTMLLRRLRKSQPLPQPRDAGADQDVLVIGEPQLTDDSYPELPQALAEAEAVQQALCGAGGLAPERVQSLLQADALSIIGTLISRPWRIVHIAGHGELGGGVVLSNQHFLGAGEFRAMPAVPELVFVNCCHLAAYADGLALRKDFDPTRFAAGVADQLVEMGVRCVVACGWAVEDRPAEVFATTFYRRLLDGARFIDAVASAREACWAERPDGKTWAAFQCYGDPGWVYRTDISDAQLPRAVRDEFAGIASAPALALALETLATRARYMGGDRDTITAQLQRLVQRYDALWGGIGAVAEAYAVAWQNLGDRAQAIAWYQRAVDAPDSSASFKAEEQLLNLKARAAWAQVSGHAARSGHDQELAEIAKVLEALGQLNAQRASSERLSLVGSAHKRLALVERKARRDAAEKQALRAALAAYRQATELATRGAEPERYYPAVNVWALTLALGDAAETGLDDEAKVAALAALQAKSDTAPDFWTQVGLVEVQLLQALSAGTLAASASALAQGFADVHQRSSAARDWSSVADQAWLVLGPVMAGQGADAHAAKQLHTLLAGYGSGHDTAAA